MREMRKHLAVVALFMLVFAGVGSSALADRTSVRSVRATAIRAEKRLGPKPLPRWYWRWVEWRLGEGYAKGHALRRTLRPRRAPLQIPHWAWQRLHYFVLARSLSGTETRPVPSGVASYQQAIAYTRTLPAFTPTRTVEVSDAAEFRAAIATLKAGDLVRASSSFTVTGETIIKNRLSSPAELDLTGIHFVYPGTANLPAIWLDNASNLYVLGGDLSTAGRGGTCLVDYGSQHVLWWGFYLHDCGGSGFAAYTVNAPVSHDDFQGEITRVGQNLAWDNHAVKGTGLHGAILWDSRYADSFNDNRFAFYAHDIPTGGCVELGNNQPAQATGNVLYEKCVDETQRSVDQAGGNGLQLWGYTNKLGLDVKYLEVSRAQGYAVRTSGLYPGQNLHGVTIEYGRASHTNLDPRSAGQSPWQRGGNVVYEQISPAR